MTLGTHYPVWTGKGAFSGPVSSQNKRMRVSSHIHLPLCFSPAFPGHIHRLHKAVLKYLLFFFLFFGISSSRAGNIRACWYTLILLRGLQAPGVARMRCCSLLQPVRVKVLCPVLWGSSLSLVPSQQQGRDPRWTGGSLAHLVAFQSSGSESTFSRSSQEVCRTSFPSSPLKHWPTKTAVESKAGVAVSIPTGPQLVLKLRRHQ